MAIFRRGRRMQVEYAEITILSQYLAPSRAVKRQVEYTQPQRTIAC